MTDAWDGRPQNPERDGAHVIYDRHLRHETAVLWSCATQQYHDMASMVTPVGAAKWWEYRGPCLTPAEIAAREAAAYQRGQEAMRARVSGMTKRAEEGADEGSSAAWQLHDLQRAIDALPIQPMPQEARDE